jgi:hypothetical protein
VAAEPPRCGSRRSRCTGSRMRAMSATEVPAAFSRSQGVAAVSAPGAAAAVVDGARLAAERPGW